MKFPRALLILTSFLLLLLAAILTPAIVPLIAISGGMAILVMRPLTGELRATLTTAEIVADLFAAFRKMVPASSFFSTDFSDKQAKFGQQVIAHVASMPVATDHNQATGYFDSPTNAKTLISDVPVTIDQWKDVHLKLAHNDLVADRSTKYVDTVNNAAYVLGKAMIDSVLAKVRSANISASATCSVANAKYLELRKFAAQMNSNGAGMTRAALVSPDFMTGLLGDNVISSNDYFAQKQAELPFALLRNIAGFASIAEYPDFPSNDLVIGTFTAATSDVITLAAHGLIDGQRVRVASAGTLPAGLAAATNYFVRDATANTFKVSATLGGAAVDITDTGTGAHTLTLREQLNAFCFSKEACVIASRLPSDSFELAAQRGVPIPLKHEIQTDSETGLSVLALERLNTTTLDLELTFSAMWGSAVGRQGGASGDKLDKAGLLVREG